jgi:hypothetical protein
MGLTRTIGRVLYCLPAAGPAAPAVPQYATAAAPAPKPPPPSRRPDAGIDDRPRVRLDFRPDCCNPWAVWNCLLLGHWTEFSWRVLMNSCRT